MFDNLTSRLDGIFKKILGQGKLNEKNIQEAMREVRRALLEADVNYKVVKDFVQSVEQKAVGQEVLKSITPGQQVIKIVYDELVHLMGDKVTDITFAKSPPTVWMLVGLQGSGKTTLAGKLANFFRKKNKRPLLVAADTYRPAAIEQIKVIGKQLSIPVFSIDNEKDPVKISLESLKEAKKTDRDLVIIDTAGRLHIDEELMEELVRIKNAISPTEILFVADGMTGQDAVNTAKQFHDKLAYEGVVLTKLDGDARGGAALSIRKVTEKPIKFVSIGEKMDAIEPFYPDRMASRILGMGDIVSLVEKAQQVVDIEQAQKLEKKLRKQEFTLDDFLEQIQQMKKLGPLQQLIEMIPGAGKLLQGQEIDEKEIAKIEAIIRSMTIEERRNPKILNGSRRARIAKGSGTKVQDVNRLINDFEQMQKMIKQMMSSMGKGGKIKIPFPIG